MRYSILFCRDKNQTSIWSKFFLVAAVGFAASVGIASTNKTETTTTVTKTDKKGDQEMITTQDVKDAASTAWDKTKEKAHDLKEGAKNLGEKIAHKAEDAWDATKEKASDMKEKASDKTADAWDATKDKAADMKEKAADKSAGAWDATKEKVAETSDKVNDAIQKKAS